jgi:Tol biopolymer transport system component
MADRRGTKARRLLALMLVLVVAGCSPERPAVAPEEKGRIAFEMRQDGSPEIFVVNDDGTGLERLTNDAADDLHPSWSPDGTRIVFVSNRDGDFDPYVMNADGSGVDQLTDFRCLRSATGANPPRSCRAEAGYPVWSPDGAKIAFVGFEHGEIATGAAGIALTYDTSEIYVMNADGTDVTRLTSARDEGQVASPSWSPDGTKIAFVRELGGKNGDIDVYMMNRDGTGIERLTDHPAEDRGPAWSPDGTKIAFHSARDGDFDVYVMNTDGTSVAQVTDDPAPDGLPSWSPDGTRIVFVRLRDGIRDSEIYVIGADGTGERRLIDDPGADPDWSPTG